MKPNFATLPSNSAQQIANLKKRLAENTQDFTTVAICATPSVSNKTIGGNGELRLDVATNPNEFFLNWSQGGFLNPTEALKICPQVKQLLELAENAEISVENNNEGIEVKDIDFWLKSILKTGFSFYTSSHLQDEEHAYEPEDYDTDKDKPLTLKRHAPVAIDLLDSETNTVVKSTLTPTEGKYTFEGETYLYKFCCLPDGSIPRLVKSDQPAFVWGNKKEEKKINAQWKQIESLMPTPIER
jgi:hypothetical protein